LLYNIGSFSSFTSEASFILKTLFFDQLKLRIFSFYNKAIYEFLFTQLEYSLRISVVGLENLTGTELYKRLYDFIIHN